MSASSSSSLGVRTILFSLAVFAAVYISPSNGFLHGQINTFQVTFSSQQSNQQKSNYLCADSRIYLSEEGVSDVVDNEESSPPKPAVKCPDCDQCDGSGRILGGIGVVLPWWPIKAYRPCPNFINRGGNYVRSGQGLDEIAFGRAASDE